ncbi:hypothetical protein OV079_13865 [Nannocystis pusilla]|uniref:Uncharacterized protein n=1 Tax=Nannocystis pusilla TaxID=889268 RepID=A0A9X3EW17_9BACT|nr:hypothetical protein [Nannocystis pusilla]MCY1006618.1 hypothetical protein [Nannocystis pusilla]
MSRNTPHIPLLLAALLAPACVEEVTVPDVPAAEPVELGDERRIELRFLRLDAKGFVQTLTLEDIKQRFPEKILRETWLIDMDLEPLIRNALLTLIATPEADVPQLPRSAQNMWKLLNMTAKSTSLDGTSLAPLIGVGEAVGLGPATILADLIAVDPNEPIITVDLTTRAVIDNVVSTHPNAQFRPGPVDAAHPDGKYPVTPGSLPVSLWDVVTDFAEMPVRFGPAEAADPDDPDHPGFIGGAFKFKATTPDFKMVVKVDLNALPYKGLDLTDGTVANVNSTKSQILSAFDFTRDDWMAIEGLVPALVVEEMTMTIDEDKEFVASGASQEPAPLGDSPVWQKPRWLFERLIAEVAVARAGLIPTHCTEYGPKGQVDPPFIAVQACLGQGAFEDGAFDPDAAAPASWTSIAIDDSVKLDSPPPPRRTSGTSCSRWPRSGCTTAASTRATPTSASRSSRSRSAPPSISWSRRSRPTSRTTRPRCRPSPSCSTRTPRAGPTSSTTSRRATTRPSCRATGCTSSPPPTSRTTATASPCGPTATRSPAFSATPS